MLVRTHRNFQLLTFNTLALTTSCRIIAMATRTDSIRSFPSSSPTKYSAGPADEVEELLAQAQTIDSLDPRIESFITANRNDFFATFVRQVNLIRSRSQAFQDCHVTVFDKVLLELTSNGTHLENAAAIHYFCEEFLAIPTNTSGVYKTSILSSAIAASALNFPGKRIHCFCKAPNLMILFKA